MSARKPNQRTAPNAAGAKERGRPAAPIAAAQLAATTAEPPSYAKTLIFVHGIGNHPLPSVLKCQWDRALFGARMGERTRMAYWVNRERYPRPASGSCDLGDGGARGVGAQALGGLSLTGEDAPDAAAVLAGMEGVSPAQRRSLEKMLAALQAHAASAPAESDGRAKGARIIPGPPWLRDRITRTLTRLFLHDVRDFFFDRAARGRMEAAFEARLTPGMPMVVVAHSQGSMVAYDLLRRLDPARYPVRLLLTIGSPLGIQEVQEQLQKLAGGAKRLTMPACVQTWVNVADRLDPVAADPTLEGEYTVAAGQRLVDVPAGVGLNPDSPFNPHSATGYLAVDRVRREVSDAVGPEFAQTVQSFVIARDVSEELEDASLADDWLDARRHAVLIQLADPARTEAGLDERRATVVQSLLAVARESVRGRPPTDAELRDALALEELRHFVSARLTRAEVEALRLENLAAKETEGGQVAVRRVWRNGAKRALTHRSAETIQAAVAHRSYQALGEGIHWAVLDSGVYPSHTHFSTHQNLAALWDCTRRGAPLQVRPATPAEAQAFDRHGHGTHVAGIIAGVAAEPVTVGRGEDAERVRPTGMAPRAKLHVYKVLDDDGGGDDAGIIKALDHIAALNERSGRLVIHGVNLSLGGPVDVDTYNVGHTPLCLELRRLWQQGVLVCIAAGNEGYAVLRSSTGDVPSNLDLSIGDPANLEEAIAVGSVHKENPHTYGVSYFSSRGPTADGRLKPDVVAPGERILSANAQAWRDRRPYVDSTGTSMACPHVSGLLAAFLSVRREFIGYPDRVKQILLEQCTSLARDPYIQGHGLPNLVRMLVGT